MTSLWSKLAIQMFSYKNQSAYMYLFIYLFILFIWVKLSKKVLE